MTAEPGLHELLDAYVAVIDSLPVTPIVGLDSDDRIVREHAQDMLHIRAYGDRVTDRLLPGATEYDFTQAERRLGHPLPQQAREWFSWRNGHRGGTYDQDDAVSCLIPWLRQVNLTTALDGQAQALFILDQITGHPESTFLLMDCEDYFLYIDCGGGDDDGAVWWIDAQGPQERAFDSLPAMVTHLLDIGQRGWLQLSDYGSVQVVPAAVREAEGVTFEDSYERALYERYGAMPKPLRPEGRTS